ncbi:nicotinate phosphoribosyltransferase [Aromatoleum diolicum]|uniref:Nicotinate phosphoribosyltransferase n=1 Tax=Aromatoleum diolicum TaxID=75796 RepID=A0ABX1QEX6_9RHOO|nr:nicotinate phosphoribosyltransferase [Aromatoleum diolicum]NMG76944.1 nicotinate phosphoribosyltransferase [Aromatoleum diolicum]
MTTLPRAPEHALLTDLYQLTMLQAYFDGGMTETASFEFFVRKLPEKRNFLIAAGLEQVLDYLEALHFSAAELEWLAGCGRFHPRFIDSLATLRFTGDVDAMDEGTVFFADEPILRVTAPLPQAQLVESRIINLLQFQSLVASKAARCALAASGRLLVDFGLRRAHGAEAGLLSARASYLAGFSGTATVLAGMQWGVPLYGTMAHSFIQAHDDEVAAFEHFARSQPSANTMLIDTYDTDAAAHKLVALAERLRPDGITIQAVRIDSGDLGEQARRVRAILDAGGLNAVRVFVSGNLDEYAVRDLVAAGAPIDGFGVGTRMNTSADYPYLDCAYKLQEYAGQARRKRSEGKATWPGRKQVYRHRDADGRVTGDLLTTADDRAPGEALLRPVMRAGRQLAATPALTTVREHAATQLGALPAALRGLDPAPPYPVTVSDPLHALADAVDQRLQRNPSPDDRRSRP